jgi:hypothetical protein
MRLAVCSVVVDRADAQAALRVVRSLRWFGGAAAMAPVMIVAMQALDPDMASAFAASGATVHAAVSEWRPRMAEIVAALAADLVLLLACDALVLRDPTPELVPGRLQVLSSVEGAIPISPDQRRRLAELCGVDDPGFADHDPTVVAAPPGTLAALLQRWVAYTAAISGAPAILGALAPWRDAVAYGLAVAAEGGAVPLAPGLGLAAHAPSAATGAPTMDAAILRGVVADDAVRVAYTPYPFVQARIERLNRRLAGHERQAPVRTGCSGQPPAQVVVLGMHRSGTSLLAGLLASTGLHVGAEEDFPPADVHNRRGYFELLDVWAVDEALLRLVGASWDDPGNADTTRLAAADRELLTARARAIVARLDAHGPWVVKDPRLSVLLPFWRPLLAHPVAVLIFRDPLAVARSLAARDGFSLARGLALWEQYNRAALAASEGMPRLVVAHRDLLADPVATLQRLVAGLGATGVAGLAMPAAADVAARVEPGLDHHHVADATTAYVLTPAQQELLAALERACGGGDASCEV